MDSRAAAVALLAPVIAAATPLAAAASKLVPPGQTVAISAAEAGPSDGTSCTAAISDTGRFVAFASATDIGFDSDRANLGIDQDAKYDVFLRRL